MMRLLPVFLLAVVVAGCAGLRGEGTAPVVDTDRGATDVGKTNRDKMTQPSEMIFDEPFVEGLPGWRVELEKGGRVVAEGGVLIIDVPGGATVWLERELIGPVVIEYEATMISAGGPNDRVSDLNCFWMARDARSPQDLFATPRSGRFADYDQLLCYYAGIGGNANTTTRFRRYIGEQSRRPLLPEHDLSDAKYLLEPNRPYRIRLEAVGGAIAVYRDGVKLFEMQDAEPYVRGHFGFRTVASHMRIREFRVMRP
jgi:hypothetical protein